MFASCRRLLTHTPHCKEIAMLFLLPVGQRLPGARPALIAFA